MKLVALTSAALLAATTAFAGNMAYEAPADAAVEGETVPTNDGSLGGSGVWLVPAIAIALVAAAIIANNDDEDK